MKTKKITLFGLLLGAALVLGYFERFIPIAVGLPGVKLGLANTVLLYALYIMDVKSSFKLMLLKVILSGMIFAGVSGMIYSFSGGLLSLIMMLITKRCLNTSIVGVSLMGAVFHNVGQLVAASMVVQTKGLLFYFPILLISAIITGILTGVVAKYVFKGLLNTNITMEDYNKRKTQTEDEILSR